MANSTNTTTQQYWQDGKSFIDSYNQQNAPTNTTTQQYWQDGNVFDPFQFVNITTTYPVQYWAYVT